MTGRRDVRRLKSGWCTDVREGGADILASNVLVQKSERRAHDLTGLSSLHGLDVWDGQGGGWMNVRGNVLFCVI